MKNEHGVHFADFYGDIYVATYPSVKFKGTDEYMDRSLELSPEPLAERKRLSALNNPGGQRPGKVYKG